MPNAVLVVDMLVGLLGAGHNLYCGKESRNIIPDIRRLIERERSTDICVMYTAADARDRDYQVEVPVGCVATFDYEAHEHAPRHMEYILEIKLVQVTTPIPG